MKISAADKWFSRCVRHSNNWTCERCHKRLDEGSQGLHNSHIFSRRHRSIRWCKENTQALCFSCHQWYGGNPAESGVWIRNLLGDGFINLLIEKKNQIVKVSKQEEKDIGKHYKKEYERMVKDGTVDFVSYQ